jgi:AcrR family transcriptional regulator
VAKTAESSAQRVSRRGVDKFTERRAELAAAAMKTLSELGYARTSLREIAQNSEFSHGVLHYYFTDKVDLITHCVREYKAQCVTRYDEITASATTAEELRIGFAAGLAQTLVNDAAMHRLWYDLRARSLFEESFRVDVAEIDQSLERMIWRNLTRLAELAGQELTIGSPVAYAIFDGLFQQALLKHLSGDAQAGQQLRADIEVVLEQLLPS